MACSLPCSQGSGYAVLPLVGAAHHACGVYLLSLTQVTANDCQPQAQKGVYVRLS
jgi:hypothetical protein